MTDDLEAILETGGILTVEAAASALAARGTKTAACANCAKPLLGAYCAVCGQPSKTRRRSIRNLLHDFFVDLVNFDSRVLRTTRALLFQPGELPAAFRENRTQPYVPSIRLYFFVSLIFFLLLSITGIAILQIQVTATPTKVVWDAHGNAFLPNPAYDKDDNDPDVKKYVKPLIPIDKAKAQQPHFNFSTKAHFFSRIGAYRSQLTQIQRDRLLELPHNIQLGVSDKGKTRAASFERSIDGTMAKLAADPAALNGPLTTWMPRALFLLLPLYALILALFHIRRRKDFFLVDHLVFSLGVHTFAFVALIAGVVLSQAVAGEWVAWLLFAAMSVYIFAAMKRFYAQGWAMTTLKFIAVSGLYTVFCLFPAMLCVLALSVFGGDFV